MAVIQSTYEYRLIYVFSILDADHQGILKIGKTSIKTDAKTFDTLTPNCELLRNAANKRIAEETLTAGVNYDLLYVEIAHFIDKNNNDLCFLDNDVHLVLLNSGYTRHYFPKLGEKQPNEWFDIAPERLDIVIKAIAAVKEGRSVIDGPINTNKTIEIVFRKEQIDAIEKTVSHFSVPGKMLWNAKMRFGKTLCALETVRRLGLKKTLILTHRPSVKSGWFEDFRLIKFENYQYGSKPSANNKNGQLQVGEKFETLNSSGQPFIYFASMQDLRGSWEKGNGTMKKNEDVFATKWDLVIIDEAHEGTKTPLGQNVIHKLQKKCQHFLYLSGTPYNILDQFKGDEIYTWDYINEQNAKNNWNDPEKPNPYEGLAHLNIRTYNLGSVFEHYNHSDEDYFEFSEFFRTWTGTPKQDGMPLPDGVQAGKFVHEGDVLKFLDLLCEPNKDSYYPFSREEYKSYFAHTFWVLPGVKAAAAFSALLQAHPFFKQFYVVNVAGEGDKIEQLNNSDDSQKIEKQEKDCVRKVKQAIAQHERTITLSCGRLTTGVSIEQWTAVFMLSGSYNTKAAGYLQTIFRAQTPFKHTPGIKTDCYAFDFAPDRTLTVIDDFIKTQTSQAASGKRDGVALNTENFLRFCSVIAIDGGKTVDYDAVNFMQQVNHVYTEHVIQKGFRDYRLFSGIGTANEKDLGWLQEIGNLLNGKGNGAKGKSGVKVNNQGVDGAGANNKGKKTNARDKDNPPLVNPKHIQSPAEQARGLLRNILEIISVRLPMMIFGTVDNVETLSLNTFIDSIDESSWRMFMPNGFEKKHFHALQRYYNNDVFIASALNIVSRAKEIDKLPVCERVRQMANLIGTFHYPAQETVLTPWRVVNLHMTSTLGGYDFYDEPHQTELSEPRFVSQGEVTAQVLGNPETQILEINSKSGVYPLWLAYTLFRMQSSNSLFAMPEEERNRLLWKRVVERNLFVVCQTPMAEKITQRVLAGYNTDVCPNTKSFADLVDILRDKDKKQVKRNKLIKRILNPSTYGNHDMKKTLKFSAVVGNPPYQLTNKGDGNGADSLYNLFLDLGKDLGSLNTMIHPARFLFNAGKTPKSWNESFLNNEHYKVVNYWANSADVFPRVDVKGGIAITLYNEHDTFTPIGFFSPYEELRSILSKVEKLEEKSFSTIVGPRELYGLTQTLYDEFPYLESRPSKGHKYSLGANIFDLFPEIFLEDCPKGEENYMARIYGRKDNVRCIKWVNRSYITQPDSFYKYKVIIPKANGTGGAIGEVLSTPIIGEPIIGHTDTFLSIGQFETEAEAQACYKYVKTKFARTMLGTLKRTQDNPRSTWQNVPLQDFTESSDIDWSKSIHEIDEQLYAKYGLSDNEIQFIEDKVQTMAE